MGRIQTRTVSKPAVNLAGQENDLADAQAPVGNLALACPSQEGHGMQGHNGRELLCCKGCFDC